MLENVRIPIPAQMFTNARREMSASLADVAGITSCTRKLVEKCCNIGMQGLLLDGLFRPDLGNEVNRKRGGE